MKRKKPINTDSFEDENKICVSEFKYDKDRLIIYGDINDLIFLDIINYSKGCCNYSHFKPFVYELCAELFVGVPTIASVFGFDLIETKKPFHRKPVYAESSGVNYARDIINSLNERDYSCTYRLMPDKSLGDKAFLRKVLNVFCPETSREYIYDIYEKNDVLISDNALHMDLYIMSGIPDFQPEDAFSDTNELKNEIRASVELDNWESKLMLLFSAKYYSLEQMLELIKRITDKLSMNLEVTL